jgi:hypothetical protein
VGEDFEALPVSLPLGRDLGLLGLGFSLNSMMPVILHILLAYDRRLVLKG